MYSPAAEGGLHPGYDARHEDHGADDVASCWVIIFHAQRRRQDEWDGHYGAYHRQIVL
jgi:hypothetical protein